LAQAATTIAGRFEILERVAAGGMGTVFRGWDAHKGAAVAVKVLHATGVDDAERFAREAGVLAQLSHPNIVRYVAHGTTPDGGAYLVTEWLEGPTLRRRLGDGALEVVEALAVGKQIADALGEAHRHGVVHRDIKPTNLILLDGSCERVKVIDFGVARRLRDARELTLAGTMIGTPGYVSPEQARGDRRIDERTDLFSLGCVLFECLAGRPAFVGQNNTAAVAKILLEDEPPLRELRADVPVDLETLVERMLNKEPADRPADAAAVADALRRIEAGGAGDGPHTGKTRGRKTTAPPPDPTVSGPVDARPVLGTDELRVVCLVLVGAPADTPLPSATDGRLLAEVMRDVAALGLRVQPLASGSLLAALTGGGTATELAGRAARAALAMRERVPDRAQVVAMGRGVVSDRLPVGEVIDRAVRALVGAKAGTIHVDEATAGLLDQHFEVGSDDEGLVLVGEREAVVTVRTFLGKETRCVGRERELAVLEGIFAECSSEGVARAVLLTGPAGVGKSHVRYEFLRRLADRRWPVEVLVGRGDPLSAGSPFAMITPAIRRAAGIRRGEPADTSARKLRARLGRHLAGARLARVAEFIGELVGAPADEETTARSPALRAARADPLVMGDAMCVAWEDWLSAECEAKPVLLVLEDLQWGDLPSVKFVDAALRNLRERPLFVLALGRPEVHTQFPGLWAERATQEVRLFGLSRKASEKLVREALGAGAEAALVARILDRADGNAFFLEELVRSALAGRTEGLPDTVLGVVQARLDALGEQAKRVLRAASVFGTTFWAGGVRELLGEASPTGDVDDWLEELSTREMIARRPGSVFPGQTELVFRSSLVREAAYAMLTNRDRAVGHALAGAWLERIGETDTVVLAEHFHRGDELRRAVRWYLQAAEQALEGNDLAGAIERAERGILCGASREDRGALRLVQAEASNWRGELALAEDRATDAANLLGEGTVGWFRAVTELVGASGRQGHYDRVLPWAERARVAVPEAPAVSARIACLHTAALQLRNAGRADAADALVAAIDEAAAEPTRLERHAMARVHQARAMRDLAAGDAAACLARVQAAVALLDEASDLRAASRARVDLGYAYLELGGYERAEETLRPVLTTAERLGLQNVVAFSLNNLGFAIAHLGRLPEAREIEERAIRSFVTQGNRRFEGCSRAYLSLVLRLQGELLAAEAEAHRAVAILDATPADRAIALSALARAQLEQHRPVDALEAAGHAMQIVESLGSLPEGESATRLVHAEALHAVGRVEEARAALAEARKVLLARAAKIQDRPWRESFLARIPENARTLALARAWG